MAEYAVTSMRKENGKFIFKVEGKNSIVFDLATNTCFSYTGKAVKTFPRGVYEDFGKDKIGKYTCG